ncbi:cytochrome c biogenesis CcdA family protein [Natrarchaeobius chitinivorans]|uniref:Cytochrome C biogenesis protein n=1 Tax=Natrarchaeobius chitinivorans TaxID=1679083 RepID=A0A3N6M388_NATCH|nr:cytochrome c biogenesis protein CcdA [Natrarchaeobius chitinivorans]RQG97928.1 cytochrome C biogenesis protein [Natrarchaeobius chitinivorans]
MLSDLRLVIAFTAGTATFFAPCAFPMLPGYVAYYLGGDGSSSTRSSLRRGAVVSLVASAGMFAVYLGLVGIAVAVGSQYFHRLVLLGALVGVALIGLGVAMITGATHGRLFSMQLPERERSYRGYFAFGVAYAIAAAGCTAPFFITVVVSSLSIGPAAAVLTISAYASGMVVMLVAVTLLTAVGHASLFRRVVPGFQRVMPPWMTLDRAGGTLLIVVGVVQLYLFLFEYGGLFQLGLA